jgi:hypothetical protein
MFGLHERRLPEGGGLAVAVVVVTDVGCFNDAGRAVFSLTIA